jgi:hypothetical protein
LCPAAAAASKKHAWIQILISLSFQLDEESNKVKVLEDESRFCPDKR